MRRRPVDGRTDADDRHQYKMHRVKLPAKAAAKPRYDPAQLERCQALIAQGHAVKVGQCGVTVFKKEFTGQSCPNHTAKSGNKH